MDEVFRALADPTRRALLDALHADDGQTLGALEARFAMSRYGVMKHLAVLEQARLVVTQRRGREKLHFLNPVPIRLAHDRWVSKYAEPWAAGLSALKTEVEKTVEKVYEIYVKATPERVWQAITDPDDRAAYTFGMRVESPWTVGSTYTMSGPDGQRLGGGEVLEADPPHRLVTSFAAAWGDEVAAEPPSRVTWTLDAVGDSVCLVVTHSELRPEANAQLYGGWPMVLSGLKTLLETGQRLTTPGSLMYGSS